MAHTGTYLGRCSTKGCRHATHTSNGAQAIGTCPDHGVYLLDHVWGETVPNVKCGARCTNAVGPSCDCSCGGMNHGIGHAADKPQRSAHEAVRLFEPAPEQLEGQAALDME